ncbi:MAG TPA: GGDEF domain-containing protein, partial [Euzebya sp.]|nr:GGDEF domain-containing protein [Euzebya sp.]
ADAQLRSGRDNDKIGLLYIDLDDFKTVNDTHGHDTGDRILIQAGQRLLAATREEDMVCRLGGDEFAILCTDVEGEGSLSALVRRLRSVPLATGVVDGAPIAVQGSIGWIMLDPDEDLDHALRRADAAMYLAKRGE